jgi:site-specific DNA-methyltransferase (adenine-specific)
MSDIPDGAVHLTVTSPPYNIGMAYETKSDLNTYLNFIKRVLVEIYRVTVKGGRVVINITNIDRNPYTPMTVYYTNIMEKIGFLNRGIIVWDKGPSARKKTSWGSWMSAVNPTLRDINEFILCFSKESMNRDDKGENDITKDEFLRYTQSIWRINAEVASRIGHPAPYPV